MHRTSISTILAGFGIVVGVLVLAFSPSDYRIPLGSICLALGLLNAVIAFRLRAAAN